MSELTPAIEMRLEFRTGKFNLHRLAGVIAEDTTREWCYETPVRLTGIKAMARIDWLIEGVSFGNCNCDYGCPCQIESLPTGGRCYGFEVFQIDNGYFGETRLDGLRAAVVYSWPGPIFECNGELQVIIDERATPAQREALNIVLHGGETAEAANHWWVYATMSTSHRPPLYAAIGFDVDIEARRASASIPGLLQSAGRPIVSPATGGEHRVRIDLPGGIEFEIAEIGSASSTVTSPISFALKDSYGQFNRIRQTGGGVVRA